MKENVYTKIITMNGTRIKLVKYWIDKETKTIIFNKYKQDGTLSDEDYDKCYVLGTNVTDLTKDECIFLYKKRWTIEVAFKQLKQNFRIRYVCKNIRSKNPLI